MTNLMCTQIMRLRFSQKEKKTRKGDKRHQKNITNDKEENTVYCWMKQVKYDYFGAMIVFYHMSKSLKNIDPFLKTTPNIFETKLPVQILELLN